MTASVSSVSADKSSFGRTSGKCTLIHKDFKSKNISKQYDHLWHMQSYKEHQKILYKGLSVCVSNFEVV